MKKFVYSIVIVLMVVGFAGRVSAEEDWQLWADQKIAWKASDKTAWVLTPGVRFKNDMSDDFYRWVTLNNIHKWGNGFSSLAAFQYDELLVNGEWKDSQYAILGGIYSCKACDLYDQIRNTCKIKAQLRFFFRTSDDAEFDHYRPSLFVSDTFGGITWSLGDEMRLDLTGDREHDFYKNRIFMGGTKKFNKNLAFSLSLVRESNQKGDDWVHSNGLITKFIVTL